LPIVGNDPEPALAGQRPGCGAGTQRCWSYLNLRRDQTSRVMQVSRATGRTAPAGARGLLHVLAPALLATGLLLASAVLANSRTDTAEASAGGAAAVVGGGTDVMASFHDTVVQPVAAVMNHAISTYRSSPAADAGLFAFTAPVAAAIAMARGVLRSADPAPDRLPQRRAPPNRLPLR